MAKGLKEYSWEEISTHNTESSCWIVLHNKVFDVTPFLGKVRTNELAYPIY